MRKIRSASKINDNPSARRRGSRAATVTAALMTSLFGLLSFGGAQAAIPSDTEEAVNPVAKKRFILRYAQLCTIDPVPGSRRKYRGGGFRFTGPPHFTSDGRMTCHRARLALHYRQGFRDIHNRKCTGRRYIFGALKNGVRYLVFFDALAGRITGTKRVR